MGDAGAPPPPYVVSGRAQHSRIVDVHAADTLPQPQGRGVFARQPRAQSPLFAYDEDNRCWRREDGQGAPPSPARAGRSGDCAGCSGAISSCTACSACEAASRAAQASAKERATSLEIPGRRYPAAGRRRLARAAGAPDEAEKASITTHRFGGPSTAGAASGRSALGGVGAPEAPRSGGGRKPGAGRTPLWPPTPRVHYTTGTTRSPGGGGFAGTSGTSNTGGPGTVGQDAPSVEPNPFLSPQDQPEIGYSNHYYPHASMFFNTANRKLWVPTVVPPPNQQIEMSGLVLDGNMEHQGLYFFTPGGDDSLWDELGVAPMSVTSNIVAELKPVAEAYACVTLVLGRGHESTPAHLANAIDLDLVHSRKDPTFSIYVEKPLPPGVSLQLYVLRYDENESQALFGPGAYVQQDPKYTRVGAAVPLPAHRTGEIEVPYPELRSRYVKDGLWAVTDVSQWTPLPAGLGGLNMAHNGAGNGVNLGNVSDVYLHDLEIRNFISDGIQIVDQGDDLVAGGPPVLDRMCVDDVYFHHNFWYHAAPDTGVTFGNVRFNRCRFESSLAGGGVFAEGGACVGVSFTDCVFFGNAVIGVSVMPTAFVGQDTRANANSWSFDHCLFWFNMAHLTLKMWAPADDVGRTIPLGPLGTLSILDCCLMESWQDAIDISGWWGGSIRSSHFARNGFANGVPPLYSTSFAPAGHPIHFTYGSPPYADQRYTGFPSFGFSVVNNVFELATWPQVGDFTELNQPGAVNILPLSGQYLQFIGNSLSGGRRGLKVREQQLTQQRGLDYSLFYAPYDTRFLEYSGKAGGQPITLENAPAWPLDLNQGGPTRISVSGLTCFGTDETVDSVFAEFLDNLTDNQTMAHRAAVMATGDPATDWTDQPFEQSPYLAARQSRAEWRALHAPGMASNNLPCSRFSPLINCQGGGQAQCPIGGLCPNVPGLP